MFIRKIGVLVVGLALAGKDCGATEAVALPKDSPLIMLLRDGTREDGAIKIPSKKKRKPSMPKKKNPNKRKRNPNNPPGPRRVIDEFIYAISAENGMVYTMGKEAVFDGSAAEKVHPQLAQLVNEVKTNINLYDLNDLNWLNDVLVNEIGNLYKTVLYAYDELPDYTQQEIENYRFYYITIKDQLESLVNAIREKGIDNN
jgi:hypothetical protein